MREQGKNLLANIFKQNNNILLFEELIFDKANNNISIYYDLIYQLSGLVNNYSIKECYNFIQNDNIGFNLDIFKDNIKNEQIEMEFIDNPFNVVDSILECKCGSKKVLTFAKQTKSCDEGESIFGKCLDCGKRWIEGG